MDHLWSPWRYDYISSSTGRTDLPEGCVFCRLQAQSPADDESSFIVHRASFNFIVLNIYPYISGHIMVVPYAHSSELDNLPAETTNELMDLTKRCQTVLRETYHPEGFNLGMNLGRAAGAGVAEHVHLHIMPRWTGDNNFMSVLASTRVLSQSLEDSYEQLRPIFKNLGAELS